MEKFESPYRDELAGKLKEIRNSDEEKPELAKAEARGYLKAKQETGKYESEKIRKEDHRAYQEETEQREKELAYIKENPKEIIEKYAGYGGSFGVLSLLDRCKKLGIPVSIGGSFSSEFAPTLKKPEEYIHGLNINPEHYNLITKYSYGFSGTLRDTKEHTLQDEMPNYSSETRYSFDYSKWKKDYPHASKDLKDDYSVMKILVKSYLGFRDRNETLAEETRRAFVEQFRKTDEEIAEIERKKEEQTQKLIKEKEEELKRLKGIA